MNHNEKEKLGFWTFLFLWFGAAVSIAEIMTGGLIAPLGFKTGMLAILLGHLAGTSIFMLCGVIGSREGLPSIASTKMTFGKHGTYIFAVLNVIQLLGWTAIMIKSAASSINGITRELWHMDNMLLWSILTGALILIWISFGKKGMKMLNNIAVVLLLGLTLVLGYIIFKDGVLLSKPASGGMSFGSALELNIVMPLSWLPLIADYTRFARTEKGGAFGSFLGYFVGSSWMFAIGLGAAIVSGNSDPSAMMLGVNLGVLALGVVVLSTVTTTFMDVYSAGVSFLNIVPRMNENSIGVVMTIVGTMLAVLVPMDNYVDFLYMIGAVFAPLFSILLADYFILKRKRDEQKEIKLNWLATCVLVFGVVAYYRFVKLDLVIGATAPVMIIAAVLYCILWKGLSKWTFWKKQEMRSAA